jgi:hypothetical protein
MATYPADADADEIDILRVKQELKGHIDEWVKLKHALEVKKQEYDNLNAAVKDKQSIVKHYMGLLDSDTKTINCNLNTNGKWILRLRTSADFKPLSRKALINIVGEDNANAIWDKRERGTLKTEVVIKEDRRERE